MASSAMFQILATILASVCADHSPFDLIDMLPKQSSNESFLFEGDAASPQAVVGMRSIIGLRKHLYEREIVFADGGVRVLETEEVVGRRHTFVYREFRPIGGRTWIVTWTEGQRVSESQTVGYGWQRNVHEGLQAPGGDWAGSAAEVSALDSPVQDLDPVLDTGPLQLAHDLSRGLRAPSGQVTTLDPTAARAVRVRLGVTGHGITATRADGTLMIGLTVQPVLAEADVATPNGATPNGATPIEATPDGLTTKGATRIEAIQLHASAPAASRIDTRAYERLATRWRVSTKPAHEAMLALIPRR